MAKKNRRKKRNGVESLHIVHPAAAGIDIGATEIYVAVSNDRSETPVRRFDTFTADLHKAAKWLKECGIESIAMESTGVYWIPVFQILECYGFDVILVRDYPKNNTPIVGAGSLCSATKEGHSMGKIFLGQFLIIRIQVSITSSFSK